MKKIPSASPFFDDEAVSGILEDIRKTLKNGVLTDGPHAKDFEDRFAKYVGVDHAVAVNSGTSALEIALRHFTLKGKEVVVPTNTFVATPNSVILASGRPIFADISGRTLCIDPEDAKRRLTRKTAGIIVVHIAGLVSPHTPELVELCEDRGLFLLEDAAHAHGATLNGRKAGALCDAGCFSFYPTKVMTSGEGGMITTDDSSLAEEARCMRTHGQNAKREMVMLGNNWRMSEITAIIGKHQLKNLDKFVSKRNTIAAHYEQALANVGEASVFKVPSNIRHSYYKYPVRFRDDIDVVKLASVLKSDHGVETGSIYYPPCHLHPFYTENYGTHLGDFPVAEKVLQRVLCLPMHVGITKEDVEYIVEALRESLDRPHK